jgi:hypothetical protein
MVAPRYRRWKARGSAEEADENAEKSRGHGYFLLRRSHCLARAEEESRQLQTTHRSFTAGLFFRVLNFQLANGLPLETAAHAGAKLREEPSCSPIAAFLFTQTHLTVMFGRSPQ